MRYQKRPAFSSSKTFLPPAGKTDNACTPERCSGTSEAKSLVVWVNQRDKCPSFKAILYYRCSAPPATTTCKGYKCFAALRLASVIADAREQGLPVDQALVDSQADLVAHLNLDLPWLLQRLPDHLLATAGVDALLH